MKGDEKDLLGSGVEYCGTCLNGVREVGEMGYLSRGVRVVMGGVLRYLARGCNLGRRVWSWVYMNGGIAYK